MRKFFNEAATIIYRPDTSIIHVTFGDSGGYDDYAETIQIAEGMAQVHRSTAYLVEKTSFSYLPVSEYGRFSTQWMRQMNEQSATYQSVAWLVPPSVFSPLLDYYHGGEDKTVYPLVMYNVFTSPELGVEFLRGNER